MQKHWGSHNCFAAVINQPRFANPVVAQLSSLLNLRKYLHYLGIHAVASLSLLLMHTLDRISTATWTVVYVLCKVSWNAKLVVDVSLLIKHGIGFWRCWTFESHSFFI